MWCTVLWCRRSRIHRFVAAPFFLDVFSLCSPLSLFIFFAHLSFIQFYNLDIFLFYRNVLLYALYLLLLSFLQSHHSFHAFSILPLTTCTLSYSTSCESSLPNTLQVHCKQFSIYVFPKNIWPRYLLNISKHHYNVLSGIMRFCREVQLSA